VSGEREGCNTCICVLNAIYNNISVISLSVVLWVELSLLEVIGKHPMQEVTVNINPFRICDCR